MKKDQIIIDGKMYLSSRRGAEIAGYSWDYIGQLCRARKVDAKMIGRTWYVEKGSILKHQTETFKANHTSFKPADFAGNYSHLNTPTFPLLLMGPQGGSVSAMSRSMTEQVAEVAREAHRGTSKALVSSLLVTAIIVCVVIIAAPLFISSKHIALNESNSASVGRTDAIVFAQSSVVAAYDAVVKYTSLGIVPSITSTQSASDADPYQELAYGGIVVTPSQGTTTDEKLANAITNSFSDPVEVRKNENANTGVITPMFRTVKGHDFMYVLVPVQTTSSTSNNDSK
ncbi:MAG: hypothetical protein PHG25_02415 [Candidatus Pacebacteria bacterium]|nr:hypothetical protein [Candidatus Paceibacterota bacterium]